MQLAHEMIKGLVGHGWRCYITRLSPISILYNAKSLPGFAGSPRDQQSITWLPHRYYADGESKHIQPTSSLYAVRPARI